MTDLRATTIAGAAAYAAYACEYTGLRENGTGGIPMALTVLRDMLALMAAGEARAAAHLPDATLLALGQKLEAAWANEQAAAATTVNEEESTTEYTPVDLAVIAAGEIADAILLQKAASLAGAKVKARAVLWCFSRSVGHMLSQGESTSDKLAYSLALDMLGDDIAAPAPVPTHIASVAMRAAEDGK